MEELSDFEKSLQTHEMILNVALTLMTTGLDKAPQTLLGAVQQVEAARKAITVKDK